MTTRIEVHDPVPAFDERPHCARPTVTCLAPAVQEDDRWRVIGSGDIGDQLDAVGRDETTQLGDRAHIIVRSVIRAPLHNFTYYR